MRIHFAPCVDPVLMDMTAASFNLIMLYMSCPVVSFAKPVGINLSLMCRYVIIIYN